MSDQAEDANLPEAQSFSNLERVEIFDKYTVKLILSEPMGREGFASNPIGTGLYMFQEWDVNNNINLLPSIGIGDGGIFSTLHHLIGPALAIMLTMLGFSTFSESLRVALNPKLSQEV